MSFTVDDVKRLLEQRSVWYSSVLDWTKEGDVIKAKPNRRLSMQAHDIILKVFRSLGGHCAGKNGAYWFEVRVPRAVSLGFCVYEEAS